MTSRFTYTVAEADRMVAAFLANHLTRHAFIDWLEWCDWDEETGVEAPVREVVGTALLYLHEQDEGTRTDAAVRTGLEAARERLLAGTA